MDLQLSVVQRFCNRQRHSGRVKIPQTTGPATVFSPIILCSRLLVFQLLTFFKTSENNQRPLHYSGISVNLSYQGALSMDTQQIASGCNWIYLQTFFRLEKIYWFNYHVSGFHFSFHIHPLGRLQKRHCSVQSLFQTRPLLDTVVTGPTRASRAVNLCEWEGGMTNYQSN